MDVYTLEKVKSAYFDHKISNNHYTVLIKRFLIVRKYKIHKALLI